MTRVALLLTAFSLVAACQGEAFGQDDMAPLLDPRLGQARTSARYSVRGYPSRSVRHQRAEFGFVHPDLMLTAPIKQDDRREWTVSARIRALDINTGAKLPG